MFIDSSTTSLKTTLSQNGNKFFFVPLAYAIEIKENYQNMEILLDLLNYGKYHWHICADLKVVAIILGMLTGYTKYHCSLCKCNSQGRNKHNNIKVWNKQDYVPGKKIYIMNHVFNLNTSYCTTKFSFELYGSFRQYLKNEKKFASARIQTGVPTLHEWYVNK